MSPRRVLAEHSSRELTEWMAFERAYGLLGPVRDDQRAGLVAATVVNTTPRKDQRQWSWQDFWPEHEAPPVVSHDGEDSEPVDPAEAVKQQNRAWAASINARFQKGQVSDGNSRKPGDPPDG